MLAAYFDKPAARSYAVDYSRKRETLFTVPQGSRDRSRDEILRAARTLVLESPFCFRNPVYIKDNDIPAMPRR